MALVPMIRHPLRPLTIAAAAVIADLALVMGADLAEAVIEKLPI